MKSVTKSVYSIINDSYNLQLIYELSENYFGEIFIMQILGAYTEGNKGYSYKTDLKLKRSRKYRFCITYMNIPYKEYAGSQGPHFTSVPGLTILDNAFGERN